MAFKPTGKKIGKLDERRRKQWLCVGILAACFVLMYLIVLTVASPRQYELQVGDIAPQTITATKDVEDSMTMDKLKAEARNSVQTVTIRDEQVAERISEELTRIFTATTDCRLKYSQYKEQQTRLALATEPETPLDPVEPDASLLERLKTDASPATDDMTQEQLKALLMAADAPYAGLRDNVSAMIESAMGMGVREEDLSRRINEMKVGIYNGVYSVDAELQPFAYGVISTSLQANIYPDEEATEASRLAAEEQVEPIIYKKGQNIVRQGDPVQEYQLKMMDSLGLLKDSSTSDIALYIGLALMVALTGVSALLYLYQFSKDELFNAQKAAKRALLVATVLILSVVWNLVMKNINVYLMPVHFGVMILAALLSPKLAFSFTFLLALCSGLLATGEDGVFSSVMFEVLILSHLGSLLAVFMLRRVQRRTTLLVAGAVVGIASALTVLAIGLMTSVNLMLTLTNAGLAALGGVLSSVLTIGFIPLLESIFGVMTQQKLLELSNPNQPLLRKLQLEAPGTYHHSLLVANLAEAAADAVGANSLLTRVGAYYHDIGKTKRPAFFMENQIDNTNPHDEMAPQVSAAILAAHVRDGRAMGEKQKLPGPILDIIQQHHGTTTMAFFLHKAKKLAEESGEEVAEEDYRYDGPMPQTKEAALIFLADTVEAAVRSLTDHSAQNVQAMIKKLVTGRIQDGQLANVDLTLADFDKIEKAFMLVLGGIYHTRIEYPEDLKAGKSKSARIEDRTKSAGN